MPASPPPVRPSLPRWVWALAVAAYVPVLVALVLLVLQLEDARTTVDGRLAVAVGRLERATLPLSDAVTPAARAANADRPAAQRLTRRSTALADDLAPLVREVTAAAPGRQLRLVGALASDLESHDAGRNIERSGDLADDLLGVDAGRQIRRSGDLASTLLDAGVGGVVGDVRSLTSTIDAADLAGAAKALTATADELNRGTRLERLLTRLTAVLGQAQTRNLVPSVDRAADQFSARLLPLVERGIALLTRTEALTRDTNRVTRDTNVVVRETNGHAANLDRKLGGDLPLPAARRAP